MCASNKHSVTIESSFQEDGNNTVGGGSFVAFGPEKIIVYRAAWIDCTRLECDNLLIGRTSGIMSFLLINLAKYCDIG
jgi:hypothetical protein